MVIVVIGEILRVITVAVTGVDQNHRKDRQCHHPFGGDQYFRRLIGWVQIHPHQLFGNLGQNHAHTAFALILGKRMEKMVDDASPSAFTLCQDRHKPLSQIQMRLWRAEVQGAGF